MYVLNLYGGGSWGLTTVYTIMGSHFCQSINLKELKTKLS